MSSSQTPFTTSSTTGNEILGNLRHDVNMQPVDVITKQEQEETGR